MIRQLAARPLEKVWGRTRLPGFPDLEKDGAPVGEIVFDPGPAGALLVKYLFTSEKLSVQVHPDDATARRRGRPSGKEEAWLILEAEPQARIALGLVAPADSATLEAAARDGTIEGLLDWKRVAAGDVFLVPPGTVHAIGAGISLVEIQQNADITYRLYDYGRPRELHLEEAIEAADPGPYRVDNRAAALAPGRARIVDGRRVAVERWTAPGGGRIAAGRRGIVLVPLAGRCRFEGMEARSGTAWHGEGEFGFELGDGADLLVAYAPEAPPTASWGA